MVESQNTRQIVDAQIASPIGGTQWLNPNIHVRSWMVRWGGGWAIAKSKNTRQIVDGRSASSTRQNRNPNDDVEAPGIHSPHSEIQNDRGSTKVKPNIHVISFTAKVQIYSLSIYHCSKLRNYARPSQQREA